MSGGITPNQTEWIFNRARDFTKRWAESPPSSEKEWQELMEQARDLMRRGRNHPLLMGIMVQVLECVNGTGDDGRGGADTGGAAAGAGKVLRRCWHEEESCTGATKGKEIT
ncbi:MAG: hypothetical protein K2N94_04855 [Lachnospiraceae bacterium]|nr:hypothetical protein [Lachnospiraceae bacterium]